MCGADVFPAVVNMFSDKYLKTSIYLRGSQHCLSLAVIKCLRNSSNFFTYPPTADNSGMRALLMTFSSAFLSKIILLKTCITKNASEKSFKYQFDCLSSACWQLHLLSHLVNYVKCGWKNDVVWGQNPAQRKTRPLERGFSCN